MEGRGGEFCPTQILKTSVVLAIIGSELFVLKLNPQHLVKLAIIDAAFV